MAVEEHSRPRRRRGRDTVTVGCGPFGCLFLVLVLWALAFGVTVGRQHYGISCSTDSGVTFYGFGE